MISAVIAEAESWIGTPYHHMGDGDQVPGRQLKGVGIDCAQILVETYSAAGVTEWFSTGKYSRDWMMHQREERYLGFIIPLTDEVEYPMPADIVVWRFGFTFSHGGIVTKWPHVVHAYAPYGVVDKSDVSLASDLTVLNNKPRPMRVFRMRGL